MRSLLFVGTVSCVTACSRAPSEPSNRAAETTAAASVVTPNVDDAKWEVQDGGWFAMSLPPRWRSLPLTTSKRRAMFARQWGSPRDQPHVLVLVARPRPLDEATLRNAANALPRLANAGAMQPLDAPTRAGALAGAAAVIATGKVTRPDGQPVVMQTWASVKDGHLLTVMCTGTADDGVALADRMCPRMVASFRLPAPLVAPPPLQPPPLRELEPQSFGSLVADVPGDWATATEDWFAPPAVGARHSEVAKEGAAEFAALQFSEVPNAPSARAMADELEKMPMMTRVKRSDTKLTLGAAIETELTDGAGTRWLMFDVVGQGGVGYELSCSAPARSFEAFVPMCRAVARSMRPRK